MRHMCCHFVKFKSVIFLKCNLEAILSNYIPVTISGHTVVRIFMAFNIIIVSVGFIE